MLRNWGAWLGIESENGVNTEKSKSTGGADEDGADEVNRTTPPDGEDAASNILPPQIVQKAKGFGGYIYDFASSASQKLSNSVVETAQTIKKSVEEGKIDGIIDKTILGEFQKEQEKFVQEKKAKECDAAVPPWVGLNEEETIQQQILALSADKRNFLRDPPAGVQFHFDFEQMFPIAMVMLEEDELLRRMRFHLVPKQVKEEAFWRNYFYRVLLIKQSAQLTVLAAQQQACEKRAHPDSDYPKEIVRQKTLSTTVGAKHNPSGDETEISTSPSMPEFVSDAFDPSNINQEDFRKEMEQLVLDKRDEATTLEGTVEGAKSEETADWEKELQQELQEYEVVADSENHNDNWDEEIEEMLKVEES